jgi:hypothetical protein
MPEAPPKSAELRRGPLARLRTLGFIGIASWIVLLFDVVSVIDGGAGPSTYVVIAAIVVVRTAIALEYVRCDERGLSWRWLFFTHRVPWERVAGIETTVVNRRLWFVRMSLPAAGMVVVLPGGAERELTPSIWCPIMHHAEFIAAARLISTHDWADVADGTAAATQPIPRRQRGVGA